MHKPNWNKDHPEVNGDYLVWRKIAKRREVLKWDTKNQHWSIGNFQIKDVQFWCKIPDIPL